jgi:DNA (cytosine-5)-methyltransferase 1
LAVAQHEFFVIARLYAALMLGPFTGEEGGAVTAEETAGANGTVLSLFTGAAGLDLGLEAAGLQTIGCIENDADCLSTIEANRPSWKLLDTVDVVEAASRLRPRALGLRRRELDMLAAGPPCQPFSAAGQWTHTGRRGMDDTRAGTISAMLQMCEQFLPRVLLIENVSGFLRGPASARPFIDGFLAHINNENNTRYRLSSLVVDAASYGIPQHRRRIIAIASRDGRLFKHPDATHDSLPVRAWDVIENLCGDDCSTAPSPGIWAGLLASIPEGQNYQYLTARGGGEEIFGYRTRYWSFLLKLAKDRPAWTLPASPGPATGPFHWDNRRLTIKEMLRLQSFPDEWILTGTPNRQVRQVGNATPPLLAEVMARAVISQLLNQGKTWATPPRLLRSRREESPPPAVRPVPVPDSYRHLIGPKQAHPGPGQGPAPRPQAG